MELAAIRGGNGVQGERNGVGGYPGRQRSFRMGGMELAAIRGGNAVQDERIGAADSGWVGKGGVWDERRCCPGCGQLPVFVAPGQLD